MNTDSLKELLTSLKGEMEKRPSVADRVADELQKQAVRTQVDSRTNDRLRNRRRLLTFGTIAASLALMFGVFSSTASTSFAEVQSALAGIRTVIVSRTFADHPEMQQRLLASVDHDIYRSEHVNGAVFVQSRDGKTLMLNPKDKTGRIIPGAGFGRQGEMPPPMDYLRSLQEIESNAVRALGKRVFDGRSLLGFELPPLHGAERSVWVDPKTKLPVREEVATIGNIPDTENGYPAYRIPACVTSYVFNTEFAEDAFSMTPEGYSIVDFRDAQQAPRQTQKDLPPGIDADDLRIVPEKGIGSVRFGMSLEQVTAVFGKPDHLLVLGELTETEQKAIDQLNAKQLDVYELNREMQRILNSEPQRVIKRMGVRLHFHSLGIDLEIDDERGVASIQCYASVAGFNDFVGRFENGISMTSTSDDVKRELGKPTRELAGDGYSTMFYGDGRVGFNFNKTGTMTQIDLFAPGNN